jgi:hypothetical protein
MRIPILRLLPLLAALAIFAAPAGAAAASSSAPRSNAAAELSAPAQMRAMVRRSAAGGGRLPSQHPVFWLRSQSGYLVEVAGIGEEVVIYVARGRHSNAITAYVAKGTVTPGRIAASFGKFGKVSMRFRPATHRPSAKSHRVCRGAGPFEGRPGTFVGEFKFRGEGDYLSVQARRAKGQVGGLSLRCRSSRTDRRVKLATHPSQNGLFGPESPYLLSDWRHGVGAAHFVALKDKRTVFIASAEQAHGKFAIFRLALLVASAPKALEVSNALTSARVSPPAPFSGSGRYRAAPDGTVSWTGSLAIDFPGAPRFPLTGPPFEASVGKTSDFFSLLF